MYLLSNAQRIFTEYVMHILDIFKYFNRALISSDYICSNISPKGDSAPNATYSENDFEKWETV